MKEVSLKTNILARLDIIMVVHDTKKLYALFQILF